MDVNAAGVYTVTVTDTVNGCTGTGTITIEQDPDSPTAVIEPSSPAFTCVVDEVVLDASNSTGSNITYEWGGGESTPSITVDATGTYNVTITDGVNGCTSVSSYTLVENTTPPDFNILPSNPLINCNMPCITLTLELIQPSSVIGGVNWSNGAASDTLQVCQAGTYSVTVTDGVNGCTSTSSVVVDENFDIPTVSLSSSADEFTCLIDEITINAMGSTADYAWSDMVSTGSSIVVSTPGEYTVTATDPVSGCTSTASLTIGNVPFNATEITGDLILCPGEMTILDAGAGFDSYAWNNGEDTQTIEVSMEGEYIVTVMDGVCPSSDTVMVVMADNPVPVITGNTIICEGETTLLDAGSFDSYVWSNNDMTSTITVSDAGTYEVTVTNTDGCTGMDMIEVQVNPAPQYGVIEDTAICIGDNITIGTVDDASTNYAWTSDPVDSSLNDNVGNPNVMPDVTTTYILTATNGICVEMDTVVVQVIDPSISTSDVSSCGDEVILNASVNPAGGIVTWVDGDGNPVDTGESITVNPSVSTAYTATYEVQGCTVSSVANVTVGVAPNTELTADPGTEIQEGTSATITLTGAPDGSTFVWSGSDGSNPSGDESITVSPSGETIYTVEITTPDGCIYFDTITIMVIGATYDIPNVFTPNGDDVNDNFSVVYAPGALEVIEMKIFDRWGEVVHDSVEPWDGVFGGKKLPSDIYLYMIRVKLNSGEEILEKGDVALMR